MEHMMSRYWINQPSALQPLHHLHGAKVLAPRKIETETVTVYFTEGEVISMSAPSMALSTSYGW